MKNLAHYEDKEPCLLMSYTHSNITDYSQFKNNDLHTSPNSPITTNHGLKFDSLGDNVVLNKKKLQKSYLQLKNQRQRRNVTNRSAPEPRFKKVSKSEHSKQSPTFNGCADTDVKNSNRMSFLNEQFLSLNTRHPSLKNFKYTPFNSHIDSGKFNKKQTNCLVIPPTHTAPLTPTRDKNYTAAKNLLSDRSLPIDYTDNNSNETICNFPRNFEEEHTSQYSNSDPKTLSNGSFNSSRNIDGHRGNSSYEAFDDYISIQDVDNNSKDEIILDINDSSNTLRRTINLETLSRIDSVFIGRDSLKLKYRLPLVNTVITSVGRHQKLPDSNLGHRNAKAAVKRVKAIKKKHSTKEKSSYKYDAKVSTFTKAAVVAKSRRSIVRLFGVIAIYYSVLITAIFFLICENPLWEGIALAAWRLIYERNEYGYGFLLWVIIALVNIVPPMFVFFEEDDYDISDRDPSNIALIIPAYKAEKILSKTLGAATEIFPPENVFVIANGNSVRPLDNTEEVCNKHRVNHCWVPYGCKLGALYVGVCRVANYKYVVMIDDDCLLPQNFPLPDRKSVV